MLTDQDKEILHNSKLFSDIFDYLQENKELSAESKLSKIFDTLGKIEYNLYLTMKEFIGIVPEEVEYRFIMLGLIETQPEQSLK